MRTQISFTEKERPSGDSIYHIFGSNQLLSNDEWYTSGFSTVLL